MLQNGLFNTLYGTSTDSFEVYISFISCIVLSAIISYLLGSINSAIIVSKLMYNEDIRNFGSKNAGLTNMIRTYGKKAAFFTLAGDILKVAIVLLFTAFLFGFRYARGISWNEMCYFNGLLCTIGHIKPIYYRFKGGKGVLCTAAMLLMLAPPIFSALLLVFVALVAMTKYISLGSIVVAGLLPIAMQGFMEIALGEGTYNPLITVICVFFAIIVIACHKTNIQRLLKGEENKFYFRKDKK